MNKWRRLAYFKQGAYRFSHKHIWNFNKIKTKLPVKRRKKNECTRTDLLRSVIFWSKHGLHRNSLAGAAAVGTRLWLAVSLFCRRNSGAVCCCPVASPVEAAAARHGLAWWLVGTAVVVVCCCWTELLRWLPEESGCAGY